MNYLIPPRDIRRAIVCCSSGTFLVISVLPILGADDSIWKAIAIGFSGAVCSSIMGYAGWLLSLGRG